MCKFYTVIIVPHLPRGILDNISFDFDGSAQTFLPISVIMTVGLTVLIRMPKGPSSRAITLVSASRAPFEAQYAT